MGRVWDWDAYRKAMQADHSDAARLIATSIPATIPASIDEHDPELGPPQGLSKGKYIGGLSVLDFEATSNRLGAEGIRLRGVNPEATAFTPEVAPPAVSLRWKPKDKRRGVKSSSRRAEKRLLSFEVQAKAEKFKVFKQPALVAAMCYEPPIHGGSEVLIRDSFETTRLLLENAGRSHAPKSNPYHAPSSNPYRRYAYAQGNGLAN